VRSSQGGEYDIPNVDNFDNYPELFDPLNPDADRNGGQEPGQDIGENLPFKITDVTRGEIENFSAKQIVFRMRGGKRRKQTKRRKQSKRRKQTKRRKQSKRRKY
jgi:hypothetical protein